MSPQVTVRPAEDQDGPWIQSQYDAIGFVRSDLARDHVVIAELRGERVALGRLVPLQNVEGEVAELGGIYVGDAWRGQGVARAIVDSLVERCSAFTRVYCLPYEHLVPFYTSYGFREVDPTAVEIPEEVRSKHAWCLESYEPKTLMLVRERLQLAGW